MTATQLGAARPWCRRGVLLLASCVLACDRADETPVPQPTPVIAGTDTGTPAQPEPAIAAPRAERPRGYVVVKGGAPLFGAADASEPIATVPSATPGAAGVAMALVGMHGDRIAVESLPTAESWAHCTDPPTGWRGLRLSLFVARSDLASVTTRAIVHRFDDGSSVELDAGAVATSGGADERVVDAAGWRVRVPIADDALGESYDPTGPRVLGSPLGRVPRSDFAGEAAQHLEAEARSFASILGDPAVFARRSDAQTHHEVRGRCGSLWIAVPGVQAPTEAATLASVAAAPIVGERHELAEGTAITWEDGRAAGLVVATRELAGSAIDKGDRKCVSVAIQEGQPGAAMLCFAKTGLRQLEASHELIAAVVPVEPVEKVVEPVEKVVEPTEKVVEPVEPTEKVVEPIGKIEPIEPIEKVEPIEEVVPTETTGGTPGGRTPRPGVKIGDTEIHGSIDEAELTAALKRSMKSLRRCHALRLAVLPTLAGRIVVQLTVASDGTIKNATSKKSTLGDATLESCTTKALKKLRLSALPGGGLGLVEVSIAFAPG